MAAESAGLLVHRRRGRGLEVLLVHPGGPFFAKKDDGAWSIPKGVIDPGEDRLDAARREFREETGTEPPSGPLTQLDPIKQKGGKIVHAWACEGDYDPSTFTSITFTTEWPPHSGRQQTFREVDRAEWFPIETARRKLLEAQVALLDQLVASLHG
jgi:predicted NUDIX family NTP pyrophosphohydrolase